VRDRIKLGYLQAIQDQASGSNIGSDLSEIYALALNTDRQQAKLACDIQLGNGG
jgi:hypothetical protein